MRAIPKGRLSKASAAAVLMVILTAAGCRLSGLELKVRKFTFWPRGTFSEVITNGADAAKTVITPMLP